MSKIAGLPVQELRGVGPKLAEKLAGCGVLEVEDLLSHLPLRYQDRTRVTPIGTLRPHLETQIEGTIDAAQVVFGRRRALVCRVSDGRLAADEGPPHAG